MTRHVGHAVVIEIDNGSVEVRIKTPMSVAALPCFFLLPVGGITLGSALFAVLAALAGELSVLPLFLFFALFFGFFVVWMVLLAIQGFYGTETITVTDTSVVMLRQAWVFERRELALTSSTRIRKHMDWRKLLLSFKKEHIEWGPLGARLETVAFETPDAFHCFGIGLSGQDAQLIVDTISHAIPSLAGPVGALR